MNLTSCYSREQTCSRKTAHRFGSVEDRDQVWPRLVEALAPELPPGALLFFLEAVGGNFSAGAHDGAFKMSAAEIGAGQLCVAQIRAQQRCSIQYGPRQIRAAHIRARQIGPTEIAAQIGHAQIGANELRFGKIGFRQFRIAEDRAGKIGELIGMKLHPQTVRSGGFKNVRNLLRRKRNRLAERIHGVGKVMNRKLGELMVELELQNKQLQEQAVEMESQQSHLQEQATEMEMQSEELRSTIEQLEHQTVIAEKMRASATAPSG